MESPYARKLLAILIENSSRILLAGYGVNYAEPALFSVIALLKECPDLKEDFISMVVDAFSMHDPETARGGGLPVELIELVAHELRWPEIRNAAEKRISDKFMGDKSRAIGDVSVRVINAFDDEWEDREFYNQYAH